MKSIRHTVCVLALLALLASGCSPTVASFDPASGINPDPTRGPGQWEQPASPDLSDPVAAVASYLNWITLAYRLADSDVATLTFTPYEEVRVNSYVQLNIQDNKGIEQHLESFEMRSLDASEPTATVVAHEDWRYRYFALDTIEWIGEEHQASYDTTYTVVLQPDGRWLVDAVQATPLTPLE